MSTKTKSESKTETTQTTASGDAGETEVQEKFDEINEQGFIGTKVDPTENEAYTVAGVTSGMPTPETNADAAKEVGSAKFDHVKE